MALGNVRSSEMEGWVYFLSEDRGDTVREVALLHIYLSKESLHIITIELHNR